MSGLVRELGRVALRLRWGNPMIRSAIVIVVTLATLGFGLAPPAQAAAPGAIVDAAACSQNSLPENDDDSAAEAALPFEINFYGKTYQTAWVNNNGNITFDGPLSTFTPFGLVGTEAAIIAPFFADVDTRGGGGAVTYGWGETVFQGHRAFCASWLEVGYFDGHSDKRNSFQLLIVEREDSNAGAFDIVFNYNSIQWEAGDASGGFGGLGGSPARAGFSNGSGNENASFEVPGSGETGAFLDGSPTALNTRTADGSVAGRLTWKVRGGNAPVAEYVALGDSYQSGEGLHDYWAGTDTDGVNMCHRSDSAYPELLVSDGTVSDRLSFWACSGAVISHLSETDVSTSGPVWDDPFRVNYDDTAPLSEGPGLSQLDRISAQTRLVTVGIGGNDMGFGPILTKCVEAKIRNDVLIGDDRSCAKDNKKLVEDRLEALVDDGKWTNLFDDIKERAPFARVLALGYPRFYDPDLPESTRECADVRYSDTLWINEVIRLVNKEIRNAAARRGVEYVNVYDASKDHELCSGSDSQFLNAIQWRAGEFFQALPESYHPTAYGHRAIADAVSETLGSTAPSTRVYPGQTYSFTTEVTNDGGRAAFSTSWPGSDVIMTLVSPSGRTLDRATTASDVFHTVGPTSELYEVTDPEPGTWTVHLFGSQVAAEGEETILNMYQEPAVNLAPTAQVTTTQSGSSVEVSAASSLDSDGVISEYLWDFGDGTFASGVDAQHTYETPGEYLITLVVTDDSGNKSFASADRAIRSEEQIAYSARSKGNTDIFSTGSDGTAVTRLTTDAAIDTAPSWSPDRSKLAFVSTRTGAADIYTMNADGTGVTRITKGSALEGTPAWSPDGTQIAFSSTRSGTSDIYLVNADGTGLFRLTTGSAIDASPTWSPLEDKIAFSSTRSGNSDIYSINRDGTGLLRLTSSPSADATPSWSPDGQSIAFTSIGPLNTDIYILKLVDGGLRRVTTNIGVDTMPVWSGDGSRIAYISSRNAKSDVYVIDAGGGNEVRLTDGTKLFGSPSWR
ncbi:hypothetical protein C3E77_08055 [Mycetocola zhujimingii]|nr:hypothetical protein C3E77_08055 [Mycetocola zhujimingii]